MQITYKEEKLELVDDILDVGYMAEDVEVEDIQGNQLTIGRKNPEKGLQILISLPNLDSINEVSALDALFSEATVAFKSYLLLDKKESDTHAAANRLKHIQVVTDSEEEFGNMYGTKIISGSLKGHLTKSLFVIGKDSAIYHVDLPQNMGEPFKREVLIAALNTAQQSYTGVSCHD